MISKFFSMATPRISRRTGRERCGYLFIYVRRTTPKVKAPHTIYLFTTKQTKYPGLMIYKIKSLNSLNFDSLI